MSATIVDVENVCLTYHEPHAETIAIKQLSFSVKQGEFVSIVGPSGCGKTSALSLLTGIIKPSSGEIRILGKPATQAGARIGYMLQRDHLLDWRTIEGNILLGLEVKRMLNDATRNYALELLRKYGLNEFCRHYPSQLSGGMRQKVALIRTLSFSPDLLVLDEPFSALDYQTRLSIADEVYDIILKEGKTAVLVTHDISEAIAMSNRVLVFTQRPASLKSEHCIRLTSVSDSPIAKRNAPEFKDYFNSIWKELDMVEKR